MDYLSTAFPAIRRIRRLPLTRDQLMLLMAAVNEVFLGVDIYLAHSISGRITAREWIPIIFGPSAGVLLLLAGLISLRRRTAASILATVVLLGSMGVGFLGAYFHLVRAILPTAPLGERVSVALLVWAPPILGPLTFTLVGLLGISAAWIEDPLDSGVLRLPGNLRLDLPYSKTRAFLFMVGLGTMATLVSSVLDHARTGFENPWLWVPTAAGTFGSIVAVGLGAIERPRRADILVFVGTMVLLMLVGVTGAVLHILRNLTAEGAIVGERFLRGAPFLAPLLFANMGALGLIALVKPGER
ncbi:MAG: hypothetical protein MUO38_02055 [Anaerolineales bacterium]|nr:hypothetical protein [Anaerolineales bacterium]